MTARSIEAHNPHLHHLTSTTFTTATADHRRLPPPALSSRVPGCFAISSAATWYSIAQLQPSLGDAALFHFWIRITHVFLVAPIGLCWLWPEQPTVDGRLLCTELKWNLANFTELIELYPPRVTRALPQACLVLMSTARERRGAWLLRCRAPPVPPLLPPLPPSLWGSRAAGKSRCFDWPSLALALALSPSPSRPLPPVHLNCRWRAGRHIRLVALGRV